jgi:predicted aspartyl protease
MENIQIVEIENSFGETQTHVIIDRGNDEYTSMPKSVYDEMIAKQELLAE